MRLLRVLLLSLLAIAPASAHHGRGAPYTVGFDYFISTTGSDSNSGTSVAQAWAITSLLDGSTHQSSIAGHRICLVSATYDISALTSTNFPGSNSSNYNYPILNLPAGSSGHPTYISSCDTNGLYAPRTSTVKITSTNTGVNYVIGQDSGGTGYFTIDGIVFDGGGTGTTTLGYNSPFMYYTPGTSNTAVTIENSEFKNVYTNLASGNNYGAITLSEVNTLPIGVVITNNYFHDIRRTNQAQHTHAILSLGATAPVITYNSFYNNNEHIDLKIDTAAGTIAYNYFSTITETDAIRGNDGFGLTQTNVANAVHHNVFDAIGGNLTGDDAGNYTNALDFHNNTAYDTRSTSVALLLDQRATSTGTATSYNNIFVQTAATSATYGYVAFSNLSLSDFNCYGYSNNTDGWYNSATQYSTFANWKASAGTPDTHGVSTTPSGITFTGSITPGAGPTQYQLSTMSPCYQTGKTGGTTGGTTVNMGAWDGIVTQIGKNW